MKRLLHEREIKEEQKKVDAKVTSKKICGSLMEIANKNGYQAKRSARNRDPNLPKKPGNTFMTLQNSARGFGGRRDVRFYNNVMGSNGGHHKKNSYSICDKGEKEHKRKATELQAKSSSHYFN